jgi:subtilisin family serine protease
MRRELLLLVATAVLGLPAAGSAASVDARAARLVVRYVAAAGPEAAALESSLGARPVAAIAPLHVDVVEVTATRTAPVLAALRESPLVRWAARDHLVHALRTPNDQLWPMQWSPKKVGAQKAWGLTTGSPRVVVAVVDSGVDANQPDLRGKVLEGYDFVNGDADAADDEGHGTAVAGVVAASTDNEIGVAGLCWRCRVLPVKVLGADGTGFASALAQGIVWATDQGAKIVNASLGGPDYDAAVAAAAQYAAAHGTLVVAAAGNEGTSVLDYPAALSNVLSVTASDENDHLYGFSNSGASLAAPGENTTTAPGGDYETFLGTSSAAPVVSGIAALGLSADPAAGPADLSQALEQSAAPINGVVYGRVDAYAAIHILAPDSTGASGASAVVTQSFAGRLGARGRSFVFRTGAGVVTVVLTLSPAAARAVSLELRHVRRRLRLAHGRRRLRLRARVRAGRYRLVVSGTRPSVTYGLTLSHPAVPQR